MCHYLPVCGGPLIEIRAKLQCACATPFAKRAVKEAELSDMSNSQWKLVKTHAARSRLIPTPNPSRRSLRPPRQCHISRWNFSDESVF